MSKQTRKPNRSVVLGAFYCHYTSTSTGSLASKEPGVLLHIFCLPLCCFHFNNLIKCVHTQRPICIFLQGPPEDEETSTHFAIVNPIDRVCKRVQSRNWFMMTTDEEPDKISYWFMCRDRVDFRFDIRWGPFDGESSRKCFPRAIKVKWIWLPCPITTSAIVIALFFFFGIPKPQRTAPGSYF